MYTVYNVDTYRDLQCIIGYSFLQHVIDVGSTVASFSTACFMVNPGTCLLCRSC